MSFQPLINDEGRHFGLITVYSQHWTPFITTQNPAWDTLGDVTRNGSFVYYYLMGWPLRVLRMFTDNTTVQIIGLRVVSLALFMGGLILYRRVLLELKTAPRSLIHALIMLFVLVPTVAIMPATINYDNAGFLLVAYILLMALREVRARKTDAMRLSIILIVSLLFIVVKWTAIALVVPVLGYLVYDAFKKQGSSLWSVVAKPFLLSR